MRFAENNLEFDKIRERIEAVSMFDEKKLIILENVFKNKDFQDNFFKYAKKNKLKDNKDIIVIFYWEGKLAITALKRQVSMLEEFKPLEGINLNDWIKKEVNKNQAEIDPEAVNKLIAYVGNDLWQMSNEINKLVSYKAGKLINSQDVEIMIKAKIDLNIFKTLDALAQKDKKTAWRLLHEHLEQGENEIYLLSRFIYQIRVLLKLKDLMEKGTQYYNLAKISKLHPFVVKKSSEQLRNFTLDQLKKIYQQLLEIDLKIKSGRIDGATALDLLIGEI